MKIITCAIALVLLAPEAFAQTDQDANAQSGFTHLVERAAGMMIKVPINENGEENTELAEMRLVEQEVELDSLAEAADAFDQATDVSDLPEIQDGQIVDGSTWGWYSYRRYNYYRGGYAPAYYYYSYRPTYYSYGNYYGYRSPVYYSSRYYRYYYYGCY